MHVSSLSPTGFGELKSQSRRMAFFSSPVFLSLPLKGKVMHAWFLLILLSCKLHAAHPPDCHSLLDLIPHCLALSSSSMCMSVLALMIWLAGWVLVLQCKNRCPTLWHLEGAHGPHPLGCLFSVTSSGFSTCFPMSRTHHLPQDNCSILLQKLVSSSLLLVWLITPFTQEMCVILLHVITTAGNPSSCSVWGTDCSQSCWRHLLSIPPDYGPPACSNYLANDILFLPEADTMFHVYSIRLAQKFIQVFPPDVTGKPEWNYEPTQYLLLCCDSRTMCPQWTLTFCS